MLVDHLRRDRWVLSPEEVGVLHGDVKPWMRTGGHAERFLPDAKRPRQRWEDATPIPVDLEITTDVRVAEQIEVAAYFVASEALANAAKHSEASRIDVSLEQRDGSLVLSVRDDGVGGADAARGSGLVGLTDRVEALGGSIRVSSRPGDGTQVTAELPLELKLSPSAG